MSQVETVSVLMDNYGKRNMQLTRGQGSYVWDAQGKKYLDLVSGIAVNSMGHCYPPITRAIREQAETLAHTSNLYLLEPQLELAGLLLSHCPGDRVFFCNSGAEANEALIKFVRKFWFQEGQPHKHEIISFGKSFHGRTYGALAATGQAKFKEGFGPMPGGFVEVPFDEPQALLNAVSKSTAAVLFEPIQAEGGINTPGPEFLETLEKIQKRDVLILCDEIQTGLGRTGTFLAGERFDFKPDGITLAKPLGGGLPLGAVLVSEKISAAIGPGDHGTTFGRNPVACAAGVQVVKAVTEPGFLESIEQRSSVLRSGLEKILGKFPGRFSTGLLGRGMLLGFPCAEDVTGLISRCAEEGLLVLKAGPGVLRLLPPLNISLSEIDEALEKLQKALEG